MKIKLISSFMLSLMVFIFIFQNVDAVRVDFLFWSLDMSKILLMLLMLGGGFILGWLLHSCLSYLRNKKKTSA